MLRIWFIFCLGSFAVSVLTLTYVQICVWKKHGWSVSRKRLLAQTYLGQSLPGGKGIDVDRVLRALRQSCFYDRLVVQKIIWSYRWLAMGLNV